MKPAETKAIYEAASRAKRLPVVQEESEDWHKHLRAFEAADVRAGLDLWNASTERDSKGELKSKWLPAPAELKVLAERAQRARLVKESTPKVYARWECPSCRFISAAFVPENDTRGSRCRKCGKPMNEIFRGRAA